MENTVFKKVFDIDDYGDRILIAVHEKDDQYNYSVAGADGDGGYEETLVPFIESEYKYDSIEEAFKEAKYAYSDYIYQKNVKAYNAEYANYEKMRDNGEMSEEEFQYYVMLLSDKYNV